MFLLWFSVTTSYSLFCLQDTYNVQPILKYAGAPRRIQKSSRLLKLFIDLETLLLLILLFH